ncbi:WLM domain-containing protein [Myxozyma melibiosi]|uniref:WLM domain-containing protein n=1 Tax=Myxozyma melibiosi TaxID=54550 RepID=A0ABR1F1E7_9ASCO
MANIKKVVASALFCCSCIAEIIQKRTNDRRKMAFESIVDDRKMEDNSATRAVSASASTIDVSDDEEDSNSNSLMRIELTISYGGKLLDLDLQPDTTLSGLQSEIEILTGVPVANQKLMLPKRGLAKAEQADVFVAELVPGVYESLKRTKLMLIGTKPDVAEAMKSIKTADRLPQRPQSRYIFRDPSEQRRRKKGPAAAAEADSQYTFQKLVPLPFLPNPHLALNVLQRLKNDRGIRAIMKKYKWTVPVLTELDPASNTTRESKLLGLNRNGGQVIELRLRTDLYDGFRDYKRIRATLCHELTHNVHTDHDAEFWALCKKLEREAVELDPYGHSGNKLSNEERYEPEEEEDGHHDDGAWNGGAFVLGGGESAMPNQRLTTTDEVLQLSDRELMVRTSGLRSAAYEAAMRRKKAKKDESRSQS